MKKLFIAMLCLACLPVSAETIDTTGAGGAAHLLLGQVGEVFGDLIDNDGDGQTDEVNTYSLIPFVGQTFTAPSQVSYLTGVTFFHRDSELVTAVPDLPITLRAYVAAWDTANLRPTGPQLYMSDPVSSVQDNVTHAYSYTDLNLELNPNTVYVAYLGGTGAFSQFNSAIEVRTVDGYAGGGMYALDTVIGLDDPFTNGWADYSDFDLSFIATINVVPEPGAGALLILGAGLLLRRRARGAGWAGLVLAGFLPLGAPRGASAAELEASDRAADFRFGASVSLSGTTGIVGSHFATVGANEDQGAAYVFRGLDTAAGSITQDLKLTASDGEWGDGLGNAVSISGTTALAGASWDTFGSNFYQGSVYLYRNLGTGTGGITQAAKLTASDGAANDSFGASVSISGSIGITGAYGDDSNRGTAYVFRNLGTATGTVTQQVRLRASDRAVDDYFGGAVSISGTIAAVGAEGANIGATSNQGAVYVFRNLDTATNLVNQQVKLTASDGTAADSLGVAVSLSGTNLLAGASGDSSLRGTAYVFRNLDTAGMTATESAKLLASDGAANDFFGLAVSLSGGTGLVGARGDNVGSVVDQGSVYVFSGLDTATGTVTEQAKLTASAGGEFDGFGISVSVDGDNFLIGAYLAGDDTPESGQAYSGSVSSFTTLDAGGATRRIDGFSFESRADWIIGEVTVGNQVTLGQGDTASVLTSGKAVYIGKNARSNENLLRIEGSLAANTVYIGATAGNFGNVLQLEDTAIFNTTGALRLAESNSLVIEGNYVDINTLLALLGGTALQVWDGAVWQTVTAGNHAGLINQSFETSYTTITAVPVPEPGVLMPAGMFGALCLVRRRRRY
jgi:hypothetical protein